MTMKIFCHRQVWRNPKKTTEKKFFEIFFRLKKGLRASKKFFRLFRLKALLVNLIPFNLT